MAYTYFGCVQHKCHASRSGPSCACIVLSIAFENGRCPEHPVRRTPGQMIEVVRFYTRLIEGLVKTEGVIGDRRKYEANAQADSYPPRSTVHMIGRIRKWHKKTHEVTPPIL